jgi:hypothetical protein
MRRDTYFESLSVLDREGDAFCVNPGHPPSLSFVLDSSLPKGLVATGMPKRPLVAMESKGLLPNEAFDVEPNPPPLGVLFTLSPLDGFGEGARKLIPVNAPVVDPNIPPPDAILASSPAKVLAIVFRKEVLPDGVLDVEPNNPPLGFVLVFSPPEDLVALVFEASLKEADTEGFREGEGVVFLGSTKVCEALELG